MSKSGQNSSDSIGAHSDSDGSELKVRIAGIGGQGAVLLGDVLGRAAVLAGLNSATSTIYGSQARGGASRSDVIISREQIDFPHVVSPQVLVALAKESYDENRAAMEQGGTIVFDEFFVTPPGPDLKAQSNPNPPIRLFGVPATKTVLDQLNASQPANFYMLGATVGVFKALSIVPDESLEQAVAQTVRKRFVDVNTKALHMGLERGRALRKKG